MPNRTMLRAVVVAFALVAGAIGLASCTPANTALAGRLTDAATGDPVAGVAVQAWDASTNQPVGSAVYSNSNGDYSFSHDVLADGTYKVEFYPGTVQFYPDSPDLAGATPVTVTGSATTRADGSLHLSAYSVSGTVTDTSSAPIVGATVRALSLNSGATLGTATTAADGAYTIAGLGATKYEIEVTATGYAKEYYGSDTGTAQGTPVPQQRPASGTNATGMDVQLPAAAVITGTIEANTTPVAGLTVLASIDDESGGSPKAVGFELTTTGPDGVFSFGDLPARGYFISVFDGQGRITSFTVGATGSDVTSGTVEQTTAGSTTNLGTIQVVGKDCDARFATTSTDFTGQDLSGLDLLGCNLSSDNFTNVNFTGADLSGANLYGATFTGADLTDANLSGAQYVGASITGATLTGANLSNLGDFYQPLGYADLSGKDLTGANFTGDDFQNTNFDSATVTNVVFTGANLVATKLTNMVGLSSTVIGTDQSAGLASASLTSVDFTGSNLDLSGVDLSSKNLTSDNFTNVNFTGADLSSANLDGATFTGTNLTDANLSGAQYVGASITGATLTGANLSNLGDFYQPLGYADLSGKDLTGTNFTGDDFQNTNFDSATVTNAVFTGANLAATKLTNMVGLSSTVIGTDQSAGLASASLTSVDFTGSNLDLSGVDLSSKNLTSDNFANVNFTGCEPVGCEPGRRDLHGYEPDGCEPVGCAVCGCVDHWGDVDGCEPVEPGRLLPAVGVRGPVGQGPDRHELHRRRLPEHELRLGDGDECGVHGCEPCGYAVDEHGGTVLHGDRHRSVRRFGLGEPDIGRLHRVEPGSVRSGSVIQEPDQRQFRQRELHRVEPVGCEPGRRDLHGYEPDGCEPVGCAVCGCVDHWGDVDGCEPVEPGRLLPAVGVRGPVGQGSDRHELHRRRPPEHELRYSESHLGEPHQHQPRQCITGDGDADRSGLEWDHRNARLVADRLVDCRRRADLHRLVTILGRPHLKEPPMQVTTNRITRRLAHALAVTATLCIAVAGPMSATAATTPAITTTSAYVAANGTITVNGTGCEANGDAIVNLATGVGTPQEDVWGGIYPISTDSTGSFTASYTLRNDLADGTVITLIGQCPFAEAAPHFAPITVTVGQPPTSTSTTSTTTPPASTEAPTTTAPAPVDPAKPAGAVAAAPHYTG